MNCAPKWCATSEPAPEMFLQRIFASDDLKRLDALIDADPFVILITSDDDGAPIASQVPVLYRREGDEVLIEGHWARVNPQVAYNGKPALLIVHGPHAYVSASWYPDKIEQVRVPTWNYSTAHLHGVLEGFDDEASLIDLLIRTSARFEASVGGDWRFDPDNPAERVQTRGISGFRLRPSRIEIKDKLNQNHPLANREAVIMQLQQQEDVGSKQIARLMQQTLENNDHAT